VQIQTSPLILTFGVTDPVGAVGVQADCAAFAAMGCHGLSVVTGLLISDTARIEDLQVVDTDWVSDQARLVLEDMPVSAFKIGVIGAVDAISVIAEIVSDYPDLPLVLDPFLTGLPEQAVDADDLITAMCELLIPQATVLLLSALELTQLAETWRESIGGDTTLIDAMHLIGTGCEYVLVTGTAGAPHEIVNSLYNADGLVRQDTWPRTPGTYTGAGGTLSATLAAMLANELDLPTAVFEAQEFVVASITGAQRLGMGKLIPDRYFWARELEQKP
jgi:hydroxymethylpyrimidine/phosphomethylpyrimidine kinase